MINAIVPSDVGDHIGLAVVRSLGRKHIPATVVSNDRNALPFYSKYCSNKIITEYDDEFLSKLTENDLIMPNGDDEMLFFAKNAPFYDYRLAYPDISVLEAIVDKSQLMRFAITHQIPIPNTYFINRPEDFHELYSSLKYPVIIKPNQGQGGKGIIRVDNPDRLEESYGYVLQHYGPSIIQEYIPFKKRYSAAVLINKEYEIQKICILQVNRIYPHHTGTSCFVETVNNMEIMNLTFDILKSLKIWGVAELEFILDERDGKLKLLEINPRFWGSVQGAISAGVDFPFLLYKMVADNESSVSYEYTIGTKCRYVICNDLRHLLIVLKGNVPFTYKLKAVADFMDFYGDDAYYVFSFADMRPFLSIFNYYFSRMTRNLRPNISTEITKY